MKYVRPVSSVVVPGRVFAGAWAIAGGGDQGSAMRPGAPEAPLSEWQVLQSPLLTAPLIARVFPLKVILAVMGKAGQPVVADPEKLPALFTVNDRLTLFLSVTVTVAP